MTCKMTPKQLTIPEIALLGGTRVALGAGLGLLLSEKLSRDTRRGAGWALLAVGLISTVPIAAGIFGRASGPASGSASGSPEAEPLVH